MLFILYKTNKKIYKLINKKELLILNKYQNTKLIFIVKK